MIVWGTILSSSNRLVLPLYNPHRQHRLPRPQHLSHRRNQPLLRRLQPHCYLVRRTLIHIHTFLKDTRPPSAPAILLRLPQPQTTKYLLTLPLTPRSPLQPNPAPWLHLLMILRSLLGRKQRHLQVSGARMRLWEYTVRETFLTSNPSR